jgi:hypothetical protein
LRLKVAQMPVSIKGGFKDYIYYFVDLNAFGLGMLLPRARSESVAPRRRSAVLTSRQGAVVRNLSVSCLDSAASQTFLAGQVTNLCIAIKSL